MFAYISLFLAFGAAAINLGWLPLPMGHWPGISLGLAATLAGILELRGKPDRVDLKALAWAGAAIGLLSALLGVAIYLGWGIAAGRMG